MKISRMPGANKSAVKELFEDLVFTSLEDEFDEDDIVNFTSVYVKESPDQLRVK